tara:strand:- start:1608 stop:2219 length:612 start_codon:yes stop_codon:yes gene_type:complete
MILKYLFWYYDRVIPPTVCDKLVKKYTSVKDRKGVTKGTDTKVRNSNVVFSNDQELYDMIHPFVDQANLNAGWNFDIDYTESVQFTKYKPKQYYNWHQDGFSEPYPMNHNYEGYRGKYRKLSTVISLSDGSKYKGGDFQVDLRDKNSKGKNDIKDVRNVITVKEMRQKGSLLVMPSFIWHRVTPVKKGTRYSLVSWTLGKPWR